MAHMMARELPLSAGVCSSLQDMVFPSTVLCMRYSYVSSGRNMAHMMARERLPFSAGRCSSVEATM
jgi:hypothetical protein